ncbi:MAG: glycosyltransferase family protein [Proteobacteria bacterium]|nr:glycosyltransferase family protein [Pseudomonadota bacterium]
MAEVLSVEFQKACQLHQQGYLQEALQCYFQLIETDPVFWQCYQNIGLVLFNQGQTEVGLSYLFKAHYICPTDAMCLNNIAFALHSSGHLVEADFYYDKALALNTHASFVLKNYANNLLSMGELERAAEVFDNLLKNDPENFEARKGKITVLLLKGDLLSGFKAFNQQREMLNPQVYQRFLQPLWQGESIKEQTLLVHETQDAGFGFGDMIHLARYIPWATTFAKKVIVECKPPLVRLFEHLHENILVIPQKSTLPEFDVHLPMSLFPVVHKTQLDSIPTSPYLSTSKDWASVAPLPKTSEIKIGLVWAGMPGRTQDKRRSCPFTELLALLQLPKIKFYSLQKEPIAHVLKEHHCLPLIEDLSAKLNDFADTAFIIEQLDLVISVDTAVAHLAGAMGKPTWLMLPYDPDWRWMLNRDDSPWYPSMRLFRSPKPYAWNEVICDVKSALIQLFN